MAQEVKGIPMPRIGEALEGGIFAGIVRGEEGEPDVALVDLGFAKGSMSWKSAGEQAVEMGGALPTRQEARVLWANLDCLSTEDHGYYWTSTQYAGYESCAWMQTFGNGNQYDDHKSLGYRVRAVRRLPLQPFSNSGAA